jgi:hypothetical protein
MILRNSLARKEARPGGRVMNCKLWLDWFDPQISRPPQQPLIYHAAALPISAVFQLRYLHSLMRRWAASGRGYRRGLDVGTLAVEW